MPKAAFLSLLACRHLLLESFNAERSRPILAYFNDELRSIGANLGTHNSRCDKMRYAKQQTYACRQVKMQMADVRVARDVEKFIYYYGGCSHGHQVPANEYNWK